VKEGDKVMMDGVEMTVSKVIELDPVTLQPKGTGLMWLSFCDASRPKGSQFLGACIVTGSDVMSGACEAHRLKINPGGEVVGVHIPHSKSDDARFARWRDRLLTRDECEVMDRELLGE
jgi:hypothetical protein